MPGVKTAISLDEDLFNQINLLASDLQVSRSKLFTLAVKDYLRKQQGNKILAKLNAAYQDPPSDEESLLSAAMRKKQENIVRQESW